MRIIWAIHLYPPIHNCGAEYVAHHVNKYLLSKGHEVRVYNLQSEHPFYTYDGVEVYGVAGRTNNLDAFKWADVIFTHLDFTRYTINLASILRKPVVHFVHNSFKYEEVVNAGKKQFVVYNSKWIAEELAYAHDSMVLYPPCPADQYTVSGYPGDKEYITLINTNENKGGFILAQLAKKMPDRKFIAVIGSYDDGGLQPVIVDTLTKLSNVKVINHSPDVKSVYSQSRILLVPSRYESWGRVATEAMVNGIPVIACPTKGLQENCKGGAIFVTPRGPKKTDNYGDIITHDGDSYDTSLIEYFIKTLDDPDEYAHYSEAAKKRAFELEEEYLKQIEKLEKFIFHAKTSYTG